MAPDDTVTWTTYPEAVRLFVRGVTARAASKVALLVGTLLTLVNQGGVIAGGEASSVTWLRVAANYLTPFLVSSTGFLAARRERSEPGPKPARPPDGAPPGPPGDDPA